MSKPKPISSPPRPSALLAELANNLLSVADTTLRLQRVVKLYEDQIDATLTETQERTEKALTAATGPAITDSGNHPPRYYQGMVLREVIRSGGKMPREDLLDLGTAMGYKHQGMAGFYRHGWLELDLHDDTAHITDKGRTVVEESYNLLPEKFTPHQDAAAA